MRTPDLSIVIPSFNQGKYIERTLLSIFKQEYAGQVEIIVSDGGSTDNTVDILKKYDKQITWWSEKDSGYADAVSKGFQKAKGEIYAIQSSDDYYLKNAFHKIIESFQQHPDASLICGREALQNPDGYVFGGNVLPNIITPRGFLLDHPFPGIFQHTTFFQKKFFDKAGGMRSQFDMCADADLFYRILHFGNGYFLNEYIAVYQRHDSQRTQTQTLKFENQLLAMVLNCKINPYYSKVFAMSEEDYFHFSCFINLFYLQYADLEKAQIKAKDLFNNLSIDNRTRKLALQIIDKEDVSKKGPWFKTSNKIIRIITHLYKKYITNDKSQLPTTDKMSFKEVINSDWWQN